MYWPDSRICFVPLVDETVQMILIPISSLPADDNLSLVQKIKTLTKDIDESKIEKYDKLLMPSFKIRNDK